MMWTELKIQRLLDAISEFTIDGVTDLWRVAREINRSMDNCLYKAKELGLEMTIREYPDVKKPKPVFMIHKNGEDVNYV